MNTLTVLGSGTSTGVPILGCKCSVCQSTSEANKRLRTSAIITTARHKKILIDASPDLRTQLLREKVDFIDAAIVTHDHADHTHGLDDLRPFCFLQKTNIPIHCSPATAGALRKKFDYIFDRHRIYHPGRPAIGGGVPHLDLVEYIDGKMHVADEDVETFELPHGYISTTGLRHGKLAYLTDTSEIPLAVATHLAAQQLEWLVIDCVRPGTHDTHMGFDKTCAAIELIRPRRAGLIHMGHEWDHDALAERLMSVGLTHACPLKDGDVLTYSSNSP